LQFRQYICHSLAHRKLFELHMMMGKHRSPLDDIFERQQ